MTICQRCGGYIGTSAYNGCGCLEPLPPLPDADYADQLGLDAGIVQDWDAMDRLERQPLCKRPWKARRCCGNDRGPSGHFEIVTAANDGRDQCVVQCVYNKHIADYIVTACNNYATLIEIAQALVDAWECGDPGAKLTFGAVSKARKILGTVNDPRPTSHQSTEAP